MIYGRGKDHPNSHNKIHQTKAKKAFNYQCPAGGAGGEGYSLVMSYWGCAAGWGRIFTNSTDFNGVAFSSIFNRITRMGSHFFGTLRVRKSFAQK